MSDNTDFFLNHSSFIFLVRLLGLCAGPRKTRAISIKARFLSVSVHFLLSFGLAAW
jgi:hypothetical protein